MENKTKKKQPIFLKFCQFIYLSLTNFNNNMLWESAAACSFSFVFSFIPIIIIILTILTAILRFSPEILELVLEYAEQFGNYINIKPFINSLISVESLNLFNIFDVFLAIWIILMARKLFVSIARAMNIIFRQSKDEKSKISEFIIFVGELSIVLLIIVAIIAAFVFNKLLELSFFNNLKLQFPNILSKNHNLMVGSSIYLLLFLSTYLIYRFVSRVKPRKRHCIIYAALSTSGTFVISFFLNKFLNTTNYNIIYGTISTVVIMMFKVYSFFLVFLFCAQMIYVSHNFDIMLQTEIYLLPKYEDLSITRILQRLLFINPAIIQNNDNTTVYQANDIIFNKGDHPDCVYYVITGTVCEISEKHVEYYDQGAFFGDTDCILNIDRRTTTKAITPCKILSLETDEFIKMIKVYPSASNKALSNISSYTERISKF